MSEIFINKARTCAVTGHRILEKDINKKELKELFIKLIEKGFDTFLIGMALGFDTLCFNVLSEIKTKKKLKIIACIPCENQDYKYSLEQKIEYKKMLENADENIYVSKQYNKYCMQKRNRFMVDNASVLVAYYKREKTGTSYTVNYAIKNNVSVINILNYQKEY